MSSYLAPDKSQLDRQTDMWMDRVVIVCSPFREHNKLVFAIVLNLIPNNFSKDREN